jgi:Outer membrane protein beta-barrel domain
VALVSLTPTAGAADLQPVLKAPAAAVDQQATGYVEIYSGWGSTKSTACFSECEVLKANGWAFGGAARGNYWITHDVSVQVDAQAEGTSYHSSDISGHFSTHSDLVGGHWSWRNPQQYLFGLFAAAGDVGGNFGFAPAQRHGLIGAEAQWYWSQFTFYAQGGYNTTLGTVGNNLDSVNAWFIRGTGRYFINPNVLIEGTVMYADGSLDVSQSGPSVGFNTWTWDVKGEWRLPTAPFSVFVKYQGSETRHDTHVFGNGDTSRVKVTDNRVVLGLKLHMGDRSLWGTDRGGATLDIIDPLSAPTSPLMFAP